MADDTSSEAGEPTGGPTLSGSSYEAEDVFENAEPWDPIETKIVIGSFITAAILLIIFGYLIHVFILG